MMILKVLIPAIVFAICQPARADEMVWLDRCLTEALQTERRASVQVGDIRYADCVSTMLDYCQFADEPQACFRALTTDLSARTGALASGFPATLDDRNAGALQKQSYPKLLTELANPRSKTPCPQTLGAMQCQAFRAALTFGSAWNLRTYVAKALENPEEKK